MSQYVHRLASALQGAGMQPGDRVAFLCPNIPPMLEAHYGVPMAGAGHSCAGTQSGHRAASPRIRVSVCAKSGSKKREVEGRPLR